MNRRVRLVCNRISRRSSLPLSRNAPALRVAVLGLFVSLAACDRSDDFEVLQTLTSDGTTLLIEAAEEAGDDETTAVRVRRMMPEVDEGIVVFEGAIANANEPLTLSNLLPDLRSPSDLRLCLNGSGQADVYIQMNVQVRVVSSRERICSR